MKARMNPYALSPDGYKALVGLETYLAKSARSVRPLTPVQVDSLESLKATAAFGGGTE